VVDTRIRSRARTRRPQRVKKLLTGSGAAEDLDPRHEARAPCGSLDALAALRLRDKWKRSAGWLSARDLPRAIRAAALGASVGRRVSRTGLAGFDAMGLDWHAAQTRALP